MQKLRIHISALHSYVKFRVVRVKTHSEQHFGRACTSFTTEHLSAWSTRWGDLEISFWGTSSRLVESEEQASVLVETHAAPLSNSDRMSRPSDLHS